MMAIGGLLLIAPSLSSDLLGLLFVTPMLLQQGVGRTQSLSLGNS